MNIKKINKNQLGLFKNFDPYEVLERKEITPDFILAATVYADPEEKAFFAASEIFPDDDYYEEDEDLSEDMDFEGPEDDRDEASNDPGNGGADAFEIPAGLLLGLSKKSELVIYWLYTDPSFRRRGIGEGLLKGAVDHAEEKGLQNITAVFFSEYGRESICEGEREFFEEHGFKETEKGKMTASVKELTELTRFEKSIAPGAMELSMDNLFEGEDPLEYVEEVQNPDFSDVRHKDGEIREKPLSEVVSLFHHLIGEKNDKDNETKNPENGEENKIVSLTDITPLQLKHGIELCIKNGHDGYIEDILSCPIAYYDLFVSSCVISNNKVSGLLLTHYDEGNKALTVELLFAAGKDFQKDIMNMVGHSIEAALKTLPEDTKVIAMIDPNIHALLPKLLHGE